MINLLKYIPLIGNDNKSKEYYLTDMISLMKEHGNKIGFHILPKDMQYEIKNVNTKNDLINLNKTIDEILSKKIK